MLRILTRWLASLVFSLSGIGCGDLVSRCEQQCRRGYPCFSPSDNCSEYCQLAQYQAEADHCLPQWQAFLDCTEKVPDAQVCMEKPSCVTGQYDEFLSCLGP